MIVTGFGQPDLVTVEEVTRDANYLLGIFGDRLRATRAELEATKADREALMRSLEIVGESQGSTTEEKSRINDQQAQDGPITLDPKVLAARLGKSLRWVYDYATELGAVKVGRTWLFTEEGLRDAYQRQREKTLERSNQVSRKHLPGRLSDQKRGRKLGARKASGSGRSSEDADSDRHGLARLLQ
jgi:hypothetical protein